MQHRDPGDLLPAPALKPRQQPHRPAESPGGVTGRHMPPDLSACTGGSIQFIAFLAFPL